jgi:hypothetical protein
VKHLDTNSAFFIEGSEKKCGKLKTGQSIVRVTPRLAVYRRSVLGAKPFENDDQKYFCN